MPTSNRGSVPLVYMMDLGDRLYCSRYPGSHSSIPPAGGLDEFIITVRGIFKRGLEYRHGFLSMTVLDGCMLFERIVIDRWIHVYN